MRFIRLLYSLTAEVWIDINAARIIAELPV